MPAQLKITIKPSFKDLGIRFDSWQGKKILTEIVKVITGVLEDEGKKGADKLIYQTPPSPNYQRTGLLRALIKGTAMGLKGKVLAGAEYSVYVHEGTRFMPKRPFFEVALESGEIRINKIINNMMENELERVLK